MLGGKGDPWLREFNDAKLLGDDCYKLLQGKEETAEAAAVARHTAATRRKLTALNTKIDKLEATVGLEEDLSEREGNRRRDMVARLRTQSTQLAELLKLKTATSGKGGGSFVAKPLETIDTAERDEHGLLVLQREVMKQQDDALDDLSIVVTRTRHIAVAVNDELDLQAKLLDEVDDDVEETTGRLAMATKKVKLLIKKSNECKMMIGLFLLVLVLGGLLILFFKVGPMMG